MEMREKVLELLKRTLEVENSISSEISGDEPIQSGTFEHWSIKDQIAHCAAWKDRLARSISLARDGIPPSRPEELDHLNEEIFQEFSEKSWEEILSFSAQSQTSFIETFNSIPDEDLVTAEILPWQGGRELWKIILGTGYIHPITHYCQFQIERGNLKQAQDLQEEMCKRLQGLDEDPSWQGTAIYNLACFFALSGKNEEAIKDLKEALRLNPTLIEWSKQDPDFDRIRSDPDYLAIYAS